MKVLRLAISLHESIRRGVGGVPRPRHIKLLKNVGGNGVIHVRSGDNVPVNLHPRFELHQPLVFFWVLTHSPCQP